MTPDEAEAAAETIESIEWIGRMLYIDPRAPVPIHRDDRGTRLGEPQAGRFADPSAAGDDGDTV